MTSGFIKNLFALISLLSDENPEVTISNKFETYNLLKEDLRKSLKIEDLDLNYELVMFIIMFSNFILREAFISEEPLLFSDVWRKFVMLVESHSVSMNIKDVPDLELVLFEHFISEGVDFEDDWVRIEEDPDF